MSAMMTRERYAEVIGPAVAGDPQAVEEMARAFRPLVLSVVRPYVGRNGAELSDLVQEGSVGMLLALRKFDPSRGVGFHTYATWWIRSCAQSWTRRICSAKLTSKTDKVLLARGFVVRRNIEQRFGRPATHAELAEALGLTVADVDRYYSKTIPAALFLDESEDGEAGYVSAASGWGVDPAETAELREMRAAVLRVVEGFDERAREMITRRLEGETLEEIATDYGVSRERVRQVVGKVMARIRDRVDLP